MILTGAGSLVVAYPIPQRWTNSYGDTAIVVATAAGFLLACCFAQEGRRHADVTIEVGILCRCLMSSPAAKGVSVVRCRHVFTVAKRHSQTEGKNH